MTRHPQWEARLLALAAAKAATPYEPGAHDCMTWCADVAEAVTGADPLKKHRGKYRSFASGYAYLKKLGVYTPAALLDATFAQKPVGFAQRGDLVLVKTDTGDNPGVAMGAFALVAGEQGLIRAPRSLWLKAWDPARRATKESTK